MGDIEPRPGARPREGPGEAAPDRMEPIEHRLGVVEADDIADATQPDDIAHSGGADTQQHWLDWIWCRRRVLRHVGRNRRVTGQTRLPETRVELVGGICDGLENGQAVDRKPLHSP